MTTFKLNNKDYFVQVKNNFECIITEVNNENEQYTMTAEELRELLINYEKVYAFTEYNLVNDIVSEISVSGISETYAVLEVKVRGPQKPSTIRIPIQDFCQDILTIFLDKRNTDKQVSEEMPSISKALNEWRASCDIAFLNKSCLVMNEKKEILAMGHFENNKLIALSNSNLTLFSSLYIVFPEKSIEVELAFDKEITKKTASYHIKQKGFNAIQLNKTQENALKTFEIKDNETHSAICDFFQFKEIGIAKSHLDNFFDI